jgi:hypothetical protein
MYVPVGTDAATETVSKTDPDPPATKLIVDGLSPKMRPVDVVFAENVTGPARPPTLVAATLTVAEPPALIVTTAGTMFSEKSGTTPVALTVTV